MSVKVRSVLDHAVSIREAAARLGIDVGSVRRLIQSGALDAEGRTRVTIASIEGWEANLDKALKDVTAMGGAELTQEDMELLRTSRPGRLPWDHAK